MLSCFFLFVIVNLWCWLKLKTYWNRPKYNRNQSVSNYFGRFRLGISQTENFCFGWPKLKKPTEPNRLHPYRLVFIFMFGFSFLRVKGFEKFLRASWLLVFVNGLVFCFSILPDSTVGTIISVSDPLISKIKKQTFQTEQYPQKIFTNFTDKT